MSLWLFLDLRTKRWQDDCAAIATCIFRNLIGVRPLSIILVILVQLVYFFLAAHTIWHVNLEPVS